MSAFLANRLVPIALLLAASAFFSGSETAFFSLSRIKREAMQARSDAFDRVVLRLLASPRRLMVTLILCNELVNVGISSLMAGIGAKTLPLLGHRVGLGSPAWSSVLATVGTVVVTVPILVLVGEMAPKTLAIRLGERWARGSARLLELCGYVVAPVRWVLRLVSDTVLNLLGGEPPSKQEGLREEEFRALVDVGEQEGELEKAERRLIHKVFEFGDRTVNEVMTPAARVFAVPYEMPLGRIVEMVSQAPYSRVPVYRRGGKAQERTTHDQVVGVLHAKDLVGYARGHLEGHTLQELLRPAFFVPRSTKCDRLFREFQKRKTHLALVVDEYGRLAGLVTMEDLLEELFGEIVDEKESARPAMPTPPRASS